MTKKEGWITTTRGEPPFKYDPDLLDRYEAMVIIDLPIYIPLPDDIYPVIVNDRVAHIRVTRFDVQNDIKEILLDLLAKEHNIPRDIPLSAPLLRFDLFNRSQVTVMFKPNVEELKMFENSALEEQDPYTKSTIDSLLATSLQFVNRLLEAYQHVSGICAIGFLRPWDVGQYQGSIMPLSKEDSQQGVTVDHIGYARNIRGSREPYLSTEQIDRISKIARLKEFPSYFRFLISARFLYLMGDYSAAIISAQSALEIYLRRLLLEKGIKQITTTTKGKTKKFQVRNMGLKLLYTKGLTELIGKSISDCDDQLGEDLDRSREIRNKIIHEGKEASMDEANNCLQAYYKSIYKIIEETE